MTIPIGSAFERIKGTHLLVDTDLAGGYRVVADIAARNAIGLPARKIGMTVYVQADSTEYTLLRTLADSGWTKKPAFTGNGVTTKSVVVNDKLRQFNGYSFELWARNHLLTWFNALPAVERILNSPVVLFKVSYERNGLTPVYVAGEHVSDPQFYVGDCTLAFTGAPASTAQTIVDTQLFTISKTLIPLGDTVEAAINEYANRKAAGG